MYGFINNYRQVFHHTIMTLLEERITSGHIKTYCRKKEIACSNIFRQLELGLFYVFLDNNPFLNF